MCLGGGRFEKISLIAKGVCRRKAFDKDGLGRTIAPTQNSAATRARPPHGMLTTDYVQDGSSTTFDVSLPIRRSDE